MSQAHLEQFYSKASKDQALVQKMVAGTGGAEDFIRNAVTEGKAQGFDFTYEEASAWIKKQQQVAKSGELSDSQLESVAGGKGSAQSAGKAIDTWVSKNDWGFRADDWKKDVGQPIGKWFSSW